MPLRALCARCGNDRELRSRSLCGNCYAWARRNGQLEQYPLMRIAKTFHELLTELVDMSDPDACWTWTGRLDRGGYGAHDAPDHSCVAHRAAYEYFVGPIPDGMDLDHTCHDPAVCNQGPRCPHRACVNWRHLEPVTGHENQTRGNRAKGSHTQVCLRGHERTVENLRIYADGIWRCAPCDRLKARERRRARSS